jgi:predicted acyl esterase
VCEDYGAIEAAVLSIGGWHDGYRNTISHLVENIEAPVKGIVGPWIHKYPHYAGRNRGSDFCRRQKAGGTRWLKGIDNGAGGAAGLPDLADGFDCARTLVRRTARTVDR